MGVNSTVDVDVCRHINRIARSAEPPLAAGCAQGLVEPFRLPHGQRPHQGVIHCVAIHLVMARRERPLLDREHFRVSQFIRDLFHRGPEIVVECAIPVDGRVDSKTAAVETSRGKQCNAVELARRAFPVIADDAPRDGRRVIRAEVHRRGLRRVDFCRQPARAELDRRRGGEIAGAGDSLIHPGVIAVFECREIVRAHAALQTVAIIEHTVRVRAAGPVRIRGGVDRGQVRALGEHARYIRVGANIKGSQVQTRQRSAVVEHTEHRLDLRGVKGGQIQARQRSAFVEHGSHHLDLRGVKGGQVQARQRSAV